MLYPVRRLQVPCSWGGYSAVMYGCEHLVISVFSLSYEPPIGRVEGASSAFDSDCLEHAVALIGFPKIFFSDHPAMGKVEAYTSEC